MPVAQQHVPALPRRLLTLSSESGFFECFHTGLHAHAPSVTIGERQVLVAAVPG
jgi:hypothetical protein